MVTVPAQGVLPPEARSQLAALTKKHQYIKKYLKVKLRVTYKIVYLQNIKSKQYKHKKQAKYIQNWHILT